jgi:hypothetical protein
MDFGMVLEGSIIQYTGSWAKKKKSQKKFSFLYSRLTFLLLFVSTEIGGKNAHSLYFIPLLFGSLQ